MEKIKAFKNAKEFNELFPIREFNGVKTRQNKILLSYLKCKDVWRYCKKNDAWNILDVRGMNELYTKVFAFASSASVGCGEYYVEIFGKKFYNTIYSFDSRNGISDDYNPYGYVRYFNNERGGVFKMKSGRFFRFLLDMSEFGRCLPDSAKNYVCEMFTEDWNVSMRDFLPNMDYELCVSDDAEDFCDIYSSEETDGNFGSCMTDEGYETFYACNVRGAKAAYLRNNGGYIVARCVIFEAKDMLTGNRIRVAERQYSTDGDLTLQRILVRKLYKGGYIDYNKCVGADCRSPHNFVDKDGNAMHHDMYIDIEDFCPEDDVVPYMDSFKYYDLFTSRAYNTDQVHFTHTLTETDGTAAGGYSRVIRGGCTFYVSSEVRKKFYAFCEDTSNYVYKEDCHVCPKCGKFFERAHSFHTDFTGKSYCSEECMNRDVALFLALLIEDNQYDSLAGKHVEHANWMPRFYAFVDGKYVEYPICLSAYRALSGESFRTMCRKLVVNCASDVIVPYIETDEDGDLYDSSFSIE